ncbi:hypothetical protein ACIBQ1_38685 [Nonomuraea sp. NPDC050153]
MGSEGGYDTIVVGAGSSGSALAAPARWLPTVLRFHRLVTPATRSSL